MFPRSIDCNQCECDHSRCRLDEQDRGLCGGGTEDSRDDHANQEEDLNIRVLLLSCQTPDQARREKAVVQTLIRRQSRLDGRRATRRQILAMESRSSIFALNGVA